MKHDGKKIICVTLLVLLLHFLLVTYALFIINRTLLKFPFFEFLVTFCGLTFSHIVFAFPMTFGGFVLSVWVFQCQNTIVACCANVFSVDMVMMCDLRIDWFE